SIQKESVLREWADFKSVAGTGQAVAFGRFGCVGSFSDDLISEGHSGGARSSMTLPGIPASTSCREDHPVRAESSAPSVPCAYPLNTGLTKLSVTGNLGGIVRKLQEALVRP